METASLAQVKGYNICLNALLKLNNLHLFILSVQKTTCQNDSLGFCWWVACGIVSWLDAAMTSIKRITVAGNEKVLHITLYKKNNLAYLTAKIFIS